MDGKYCSLRYFFIQLLPYWTSILAYYLYIAGKTVQITRKFGHLSHLKKLTRKSCARLLLADILWGFGLWADEVLKNLKIPEEDCSGY